MHGKRKIKDERGRMEKKILKRKERATRKAPTERNPAFLEYWVPSVGGPALYLYSQLPLTEPSSDKVLSATVSQCEVQQDKALLPLSRICLTPTVT